MNLKQKLISGASYSSAGVILENMVRLVSTLVLTRLLSPDLFGLMALAATFTYALAMLSDVGLRSAIIQSERADDRNYRDSVWTLILLRGFLIAILLVLSGGVVYALQNAGFISATAVYGDRRLVQILMLLAVAEAIGGMGSIYILYSERKLEFGRLFVLTTARQVIGTVVTIVWAYFSPGVVALCSGAIATNLASAVISHMWLAKEWPRLRWSLEDFGYIFSRGKWLLVGAVFAFLTNAFDRVYMGSILSPIELGIYSIAATLGLVAREFMYRVGSSVVFPALAEKIRVGDGALSSDIYKLRRPFEYVSLLVGFILIALGPIIIKILYDDRYLGAGQILSFFGLFILLFVYEVNSFVYLSMGKNREHTSLGVVKLLFMMAATISFIGHVGALAGVLGLIFGQIGLAVLSLFINRRLGLVNFGGEVIYVLKAGLVVVLAYAVHSILYK